MSVLIVSPHTDDAELGCGGTISHLLDEGTELLWIVFSSAKDSLPDGYPKNRLQKEFYDAIEVYDIDPDNTIVHDFKVRYLNEHRQEVLDQLVEIKKSFDPGLVIGPSRNDYHQDHQVVANEMIRAFKTSASIISYELPWNHIEFETQLFVPLKEEHMQKKWKALKRYETQIEMEKGYFSREFIFGMARTRGVQCESKYAEAFEVLRWMM